MYSNGYSVGDISEMAAGLEADGWREDLNLPDGWRVRSVGKNWRFLSPPPDLQVCKSKSDAEHSDIRDHQYIGKT